MRVSINWAQWGAGGNTSKSIQNLIVEVFRLNGALIKSGDRLVKDLDLTSARWQIIGALAMSGEPLTVPQVARQMGLSRQAVQRIANDLASKKLISLNDFPEDKRTRFFQLTPSGQKIYNQATERQVVWINEVCKNFPPEEIAAAGNLLKRFGNSCLDLERTNAEDKGKKP